MLMQALRLALAAVVVVALVGSVRAEDKKDNKDKIVAVWEVVKASEGTVPVGATLEFTKDGKMKMMLKDKSEDGTYKVDGDKLTLFKGGDEKSKKEVSIKKLTDSEFVAGDDSGKTVEFKKKK